MAILGQARLGKARLGAFRLNYCSPNTFITIGGTRCEQYVRRDSLRIEDRLSTLQGNIKRASFRIGTGLVPTVGQDVQISCFSPSAPDRIFGGTIQAIDQVIEGQRANVAFDVTAIGYASWLLNRRLVYKVYTNQSASSIVADLIATFTSGGFTTRKVQGGLPAVSVTFENAMVGRALTELATLVGAYWSVDDAKDITFTTADGRTPITLTAANILSLVARTDLSQIRTRVYVIGARTNTPVPVAAAATTIPVRDGSLFSSGLALVGSQPVEYSAVTAEAGSIVGPGAGPTAKPIPFLWTTGTNLTADAAYRYAFTFVTAAGESTPSPTSVAITPRNTSLPNPTETPTFYASFSSGGGGPTPGGTYRYKLTAAVDGGGDTLPGPASAAMVPSGNRLQISASITLAAGSRYVRLYRTTNGGSTYLFLTSFDLAGTFSTIVQDGGLWEIGGFVDDVSDGSLGSAAPSSNTATRGAVDVTGIAIGGGSVTSRKVYRTAANGSQLKLLTTIANNVATTFVDNVADGSLGANAPTSDASGLTMPSGSIAVGATTIRIAAPTAFPSTGGWVVIAGQQISFTGTDDLNLTGVPATGAGAVLASISYGTTALLPATLTGIPAAGPRSLLAAVADAADVAVFVQRDDTAAQTALAAIEGGDGIHEHTVRDDTLTIAAANARGDAELALFKSAETVLTFESLRLLASGLTVTFSIGSPTNVSGSYTVRRVSMTFIETKTGQSGVFVYPRRSCEASQKVHFAFEDVLGKLMDEIGS